MAYLGLSAYLLPRVEVGQLIPFMGADLPVFLNQITAPLNQNPLLAVQSHMR